VKQPTAHPSGRTATGARMHWCDLRRRRLALLLLIAMPAAFYLSLPPEDPFAPMGAVIGLSFTVAGAAIRRAASLTGSP
jgi:hypothetical protein